MMAFKPSNFFSIWSCVRASHSVSLCYNCYMVVVLGPNAANGPGVGDWTYQQSAAFEHYWSHNTKLCSSKLQYLRCPNSQVLLVEAFCRRRFGVDGFKSFSTNDNVHRYYYVNDHYWLASWPFTSQTWSKSALFRAGYQPSPLIS